MDNQNTALLEACESGNVGKISREISKYKATKLPYRLMLASAGYRGHDKAVKYIINAHRKAGLEDSLTQTLFSVATHAASNSHRAVLRTLLAICEFSTKQLVELITVAMRAKNHRVISTIVLGIGHSSRVLEQVNDLIEDTQPDDRHEAITQVLGLLFPAEYGTQAAVFKG